MNTTVEAQSQTDPIKAGIGNQSGEISEDQEIWYKLDMSEGNYEISISGDEGTDFDLFLMNDNFKIIDSSRETYYPEKIEYLSITNQTSYIKILAFDGSGDYNLTITYSEFKELELGTTQGKFSELYESHFFKINSEDTIYNLTLDADSSNYQFSLLDDNFTVISEGSGYYIIFHIFNLESEGPLCCKLIKYKTN